MHYTRIIYTEGQQPKQHTERATAAQYARPHHTNRLTVKIADAASP